MQLLIAARTSDLARIQAYEVGGRLAEAHPQLQIQYHFRQSLGDINQEDPLWAMPEKGVFTQDFREGLRRGEWDMVVHSWKDLPTEGFPDTEVVATLPRADSRDLFLFKPASLGRLKHSAQLRVFSSSPRRSHNLNGFLQQSLPVELTEVDFVPVRGNILTRIEKLLKSAEVDGLIVAKAAIDRLLAAGQEEFVNNRRKLLLYLDQLWWQVLPLSVNPTAAAQGALAIEIQAQRHDLRQLLSPLNCPDTWRAVHQERNRLKSLGGGCHQKLGISHRIRPYAEWTLVRGESPDGTCLDDESLFLTQPLELEKPFSGRLEIFSREPLSVPSLPADANAHFVARSFALPADFQLPSGHLLWTAGVKTWLDLARRGYWVNGTSDSLGEAEEFGLERLAPQRRWLKWSHADTPDCAWAQLIKSYRLNPKSLPVNLADYREFFWMSGSQFKEALRQQPKLLEARHFCGPGQTFTQIQEVLRKAKVSGPTVLPSYGAWLKLLKDSQ